MEGASSGGEADEQDLPSLRSRPIVAAACGPPEWLPPDHLACFISDVVDQLDLSAVTARYQGEERGGPPYHPSMMVKALLYGYCTGLASSRRIAQRLHDNIVCPGAGGQQHPGLPHPFSDFRKDHLEALAGLFRQVLELCRRPGLVQLGHMALDSTKARAPGHPR